MQTVFDFTVPGSAVSYRRSTGAGFVDAAALQDAPRLHTPQMAANWQPMWWYGGWCAGFAAGPRGVAASPAPCLPAADLAGRELPVWFRADLPGEGTYQVSLRLCGRGGPVRVFAGRRRLMWQGTLTEGQVRELRFPLDVTPLVPDGETQPALNAAADLAVTGADLQAVCLQPAAMPRVFLMGDSTVTDQCAGLPYAPGSSYAGWGQMLGRFLPGDWCVSNHAHSGLTTESFTEGGHWAIVEPRLRAGACCSSATMTRSSRISLPGAATPNGCAAICGPSGPGAHSPSWSRRWRATPGPPTAGTTTCWPNMRPRSLIWAGRNRSR